MLASSEDEGVLAFTCSRLRAAMSTQDPVSSSASSSNSACKGHEKVCISATYHKPTLTRSIP